MSPSSDQRLAARQPAASRKPVMFQSWRHLLFLHWRVDPEAIQRMLPAGLTVDVFRGDGFVGIVPFFMCRIRPRFLPPVPWLSNFLELNVRTYVYDADGVPGVWFFSLDANRAPAVWLARTFFKLPYRLARMAASVSPEDAWVDYRCRSEAGSYSSRFRYRGSGPASEAELDSLEFFLLERYFLFAHDPRSGQIWRGQVAHHPYRFRTAEVEAFDAAPMHRHGISPSASLAPTGFHHACVADDVDVRIYGLDQA